MLNSTDFSKITGLGMAMLNITSLLKHMDEIRVLLTIKNFDVLAIKETRLDCTISDDLVSVSNYDIIRFDRNRNGGGVCIYINNTISYSNISHRVPDNLEAVCIQDTKPFIIGSIYRPPNCSV